MTNRTGLLSGQLCLPRAAIRSVKAVFSQISDDREGAALITTTLTLPKPISLVGLAVDVEVWSMTKRYLQAAIDDAAWSVAVTATSGASK